MTAHSRASRSAAAFAARITRASSAQTYLTIRWLVDRDRADEAFLAYAYFRWLDDMIDVTLTARDQRLAFIAEQKAILERTYRGDFPRGLAPEEALLVNVIRSDRREHAGLESYLRNMMTVMEFDAGRRDRLITEKELAHYTRSLSVAVMDGLTYFIGHCFHYPDSPSRYLAVMGAHVAHMLRDTCEDVQAGYYNIPREVLEANRLSAAQVQAPAYQEWVRSRVALARSFFVEGRRYIGRLTHFRARLAGCAYCARFEMVLDRIERDGFVLRSDYRQSWGGVLRRGLPLLAGW